MRKMQFIILTALLGAGAMAPAFADQMSSSQTASRPHQDPVAKVDQRLARLKEELRITGDQEQAWSAYAEKTRSNVKEMRDQMEAAMREPVETAPQRFDRHIELMKKRLVNFENMDQALKQLYAALTPEQKAIADRHFSRMRR